MTYSLDTNTCIYFLKGTYPSIKARLLARRPDELRIPTMVAAELRFDARRSARRAENELRVEEFLAQFEMVPFDEGASQQYAVIRTELEGQGLPIGPNDLVIAATVKATGGVLVTHNTREFSRVSGLMIEDWVER